jgi:hypothetical protein
MKHIYLPLVLFISLIQSVSASTISQINTTQLVNDAESVFEGEVVSARSEINPNGNIYTYVDLLVLDVLVGDLDLGSTITLRFTGGTVGELRLDVGSTIPKNGEHGIYVIEAMGKGLTNPLLGWSQGHFRILADGRVMAGNNQVVVGVEGEKSNNTPALNSIKLNILPGISQGVANGITTNLLNDKGKTIVEKSRGKPVLIDEFKSSLKALRSK